MASGSGTCDPETKEKNYLRLQLLLIKQGTGILKARFDHSIPVNNLQNTLKLYEPILKKEKHENIILKNNYDRLFPQSSQESPDSSKFDISLLVYLLRTIKICGLNRKSQWWDEKDNNNIPDTVHDEEADITRIRNVRNEMQHRHVASLEKVEFDSMWDILEKAMLRIASKCGITDQQQRIDVEKNKKLDVLSQEMINLRKNTEIFLEDYNNSSHYVETDSYKKAKEILKKDKILVLTGHPGEGKTTMAARLALSTSQLRNCVCLSKASDWRILNLELKLAYTVVIDDIFGDGALDPKRVSEWKHILPEIEKAAKKGYIRVIITSRNYIFKEAKKNKKEMSLLPGMFKKKNGHTLLLTSSNLTRVERHDILRVLARKNNQDISEDKVNDCIKAASKCQPGNESENFVFGFPECASMFVRNEEMFKTGALFFEKPASFFIEYLEELYRGEGRDKFMALVSVWVKESKRLSLDELKNTKTVSDSIKQMADVFDIELSNKFLNMIKDSLKTHSGDFLIFNENTDEYKFSHNIIGDMVGLVIAKKKLEETVEVCPRDFLMERISVNDDNDFTVFIKERKYDCLAKKFTNMILRRNCNIHSESTDNTDFQMLKRRGQRGNVIKVDDRIDFGIIKHKAFSSVKFVNVFLDYIGREKLVKDVFSIPVMSMEGYFLDYGITMQKLDMCLLGYAFLSKASVFAQEGMKRKEIKVTENLDPAIALLLATHSNDKKSIQFLLENGATVTGDAIYIAAHKYIEHLEMFLKYPGVDVNDRGNAINGNYPLITAARNGLKDAVLRMLNCGCSPNVKNTANMTALHKAVIYKRSDIVSSLIEAGAPLDIKGGKYKRTPLHIVADLGNLNIAKQLISKGDSLEKLRTLKIKDYRGQFPIHLAAIRGNVEIVKYLLPIDRTQETLRISSYGTKSMIKGMSLFHIAIWKKNAKLLDALVHMDVDPNVTDFYGRTPLFFAITEGNLSIVKRMIAYTKTDKAKPQKQGYTPLHAAIHNDMNATAEQLINHTNVNARDRYGKTPIHVACEKVNIAMIKSLLRSGADPTMITKREDTVFHLLKRRSNLTSSKIIERSKRAQILLAEWDKDFFQLLPSLRNKSGTVVKIPYVPTGSISREKLLQLSPMMSQTTSKTTSDEECIDKSDDDDDDDDEDSFDNDYGEDEDDDDSGDDGDYDNEYDDDDCDNDDDDDDSDDDDYGISDDYDDYDDDDNDDDLW